MPEASLKEFIAALKKNDIETVKRFLKEDSGLASRVVTNKAYWGLDISGDYASPIHLATENGNVQLINLLVAHGADVNVKFSPESDLITASGRRFDRSSTPLQTAYNTGNMDVALALRGHNAKCYPENPELELPAFRAACLGPHTFNTFDTCCRANNPQFSSEFHVSLYSNVNDIPELRAQNLIRTSDQYKDLARKIPKETTRDGKFNPEFAAYAKVLTTANELVLAVSPRGCSPSEHANMVHNLVANTYQGNWTNTAKKLEAFTVDDAVGFRDTLRNFIQVTVLPEYARRTQRYTRAGMVDTSQAVDELMFPVAQVIMGKRGLPVLLDLQRDWHQDRTTIETNLRQTQFLRQLDWLPLTKDQSTNDLTITFMTTSKALRALGDQEQHCVGGYDVECRNRGVHIGVVKRGDVVVSTFSICEGREPNAREQVYVEQHMYKGNVQVKANSPEEQAVNTLVERIRRKDIAIDFDALQNHRTELQRQNQGSDVRYVCGFDPFAADSAEHENKALQLYARVRTGGRDGSVVRRSHSFIPDSYATGEEFLVGTGLMGRIRVLAQDPPFVEGSNPQPANPRTPSPPIRGPRNIDGLPQSDDEIERGFRESATRRQTLDRLAQQTRGNRLSLDPEKLNRLTEGLVEKYGASTGLSERDARLLALSGKAMERETLEYLNAGKPAAQLMPKIYRMLAGNEAYRGIVPENIQAVANSLLERYGATGLTGYDARLLAVSGKALEPDTLVHLDAGKPAAELMPRVYSALSDAESGKSTKPIKSEPIKLEPIKIGKKILEFKYPNSSLNSTHSERVAVRVDMKKFMALTDNPLSRMPGFFRSFFPRDDYEAQDIVRYKKINRAIHQYGELDMPEVNFNGRVGINEGRHRLRALEAAGAETIYVLVPKSQADALRDAAGAKDTLPDPQPATAKKPPKQPVELSTATRAGSSMAGALMHVQGLSHSESTVGTVVHSVGVTNNIVGGTAALRGAPLSKKISGLSHGANKLTAVYSIGEKTVEGGIVEGVLAIGDFVADKFTLGHAGTSASTALKGAGHSIAGVFEYVFKGTTTHFDKAKAKFKETPENTTVGHAVVAAPHVVSSTVDALLLTWSTQDDFAAGRKHVISTMKTPPPIDELAPSYRDYKHLPGVASKLVEEGLLGSNHEGNYHSIRKALTQKLKNLKDGVYTDAEKNDANIKATRKIYESALRELEDYKYRVDEWPKLRERITIQRLNALQQKTDAIKAERLVVLVEAWGNAKTIEERGDLMAETERTLKRYIKPELFNEALQSFDPAAVFKKHNPLDVLNGDNAYDLITVLVKKLRAAKEEWKDPSIPLPSLKDGLASGITIIDMPAKRDRRNPFLVDADGKAKKDMILIGGTQDQLSALANQLTRENISYSVQFIPALDGTAMQALSVKKEDIAPYLPSDKVAKDTRKEESLKPLSGLAPSTNVSAPAKQPGKATPTIH